MSVPADHPRADALREPLAPAPSSGSTAVDAPPGDHRLAADGTTVGAGRSGSGSGTAGTADTAKQEASGVASEAADQGKRVAGTAADQASQVTSEAGRQAKDLYHQTRGQLADQASTGQRQAASGLGSLAEELKGLAEGRAGSGVATDLVHQASQRVEAVGTWLERREPADVLREVEGFARRRPVAFLAIAAGVGLVAGRLTRGLTAAAQDQGTGGAGSAQSDTPATYASDTTYASTRSSTVPAATPVRPAPVLATEDFDVTEEPLRGGPATGGRTSASTGGVPGWDEPQR